MPVTQGPPVTLKSLSAALKNGGHSFGPIEDLHTTCRSCQLEVTVVGLMNWETASYPDCPYVSVAGIPVIGLNKVGRPPTLAAPVDPKGYRKYFEALAEKVILLAWKGRARIRLWNYWPDSTQWSLSILPGIHLSKACTGDTNFKYRLGFGWLAWGFDIGLVPPKRVVVSEAHEGVSLACVNRGEPVHMPERTEAYIPDEANERP